MPDFNLKLPNFTAEMSWSCRIKFSMVDDIDDDDIPFKLKQIFLPRTQREEQQIVCYNQMFSLYRILLCG